MTAEQIISDWKNKKFKPTYWLEGEENYYIDKITDFAEHNILPQAEAEFNLTIFYGRDALWQDVVNACKKFPMFAEQQVVLLKEAQQMKDLAKLESYFEHPQPTTIFIVAHKEKKLDARTKFAKTIKQKSEIVSTSKINDSKLPDWTAQMIRQHGYDIDPKALLLLVDHIGNDLSRIANEAEKIFINLQNRKIINTEDIENFVGISKEFNPFELQLAIAQKDLPKAIRIIQYFESNPKAAPIQLVLPTLYNFFSKTAMVFSSSGPERNIAAAIGVNPFFVKDYLMAAKNYGQDGVERILLLLHAYNLRSIGIDSVGTNDGELLKELTAKIMY